MAAFKMRFEAVADLRRHSVVCFDRAGLQSAVPGEQREEEESGDKPKHAEGQQQARQIITDQWAFKRSLQMWPSPM